MYQWPPGPIYEEEKQWPYVVLFLLIVLCTLLTGYLVLRAKFPQYLPNFLTNEQTQQNSAIPQASGEIFTTQVKVSYYWPPLGGTNCFDFRDGYCHSAMRSGERWEDWVELAIACPPEWPHWTVVTVGGREWVCLDTGGAIVTTNGVSWIDMLIEKPVYPFGTVVDATVQFP